MTKLETMGVGILLLLFSFLTLLSCKKEMITIRPEPPTIPPEGYGKLDILWQTPLGVADTNIYLNPGVILVEDKVAATPGKSDRTMVYFWDKKTGNYLFEWGDWIKPRTVSSTVQIIDGNIFGNSWTQTFLLDSNTGNAIWRSEPLDPGHPRAKITLGEIFHPIIDKSPQDADFAFLTSLNKNSGARDTILTVPKLGEYEPVIEPPMGWESPNGDSILIFVNRTLNFGGDLDERLDIYAFNMTADSIEWKLLDFDIEGTSRIGPPLVSEDLVYIAGKRTLYCLNASDGSLLWKRRFEDNAGGASENLFISAMIKVGNRLVISPTNGNTYCFNATSGLQLWKESDSAHSPQNMVHHNGIIYMVGRGNGKLFAFDLETGEHYWREYPPNRRSDSRAGFYNDIAIDPETGYIYADDSFFVLCIKPYERE